FEHSVANMFFIPMGIAIAKGASAGAATALKMDPAAMLTVFSYKTFALANLVPVTLGNIVGGSIFVGFAYYLLYLKK
ncbi:MAG: formate/nitrite transporter family protein, partial [Firmicutes bacterium]|nr:formate/nitrite transporter family protein [Bacillota bacterium]